MCQSNTLYILNLYNVTFKIYYVKKMVMLNLKEEFYRDLPTLEYLKER